MEVHLLLFFVYFWSIHSFSSASSYFQSFGCCVDRAFFIEEEVKLLQSVIREHVKEVDGETAFRMEGRGGIGSREKEQEVRK